MNPVESSHVLQVQILCIVASLHFSSDIKITVNINILVGSSLSPAGQSTQSLTEGVPSAGDIVPAGHTLREHAMGEMWQGRGESCSAQTEDHGSKKVHSSAAPGSWNGCSERRSRSLRQKRRNTSRFYGNIGKITPPNIVRLG